MANVWIAYFGCSGKVNGVDYLKYYDIEKYLFGTVSPRFHNDTHLCAFDFLSIVNWKSPRPKREIIDGLREWDKTDLEKAVRKLTHDIHQAADNQARLKILLGRPGFGLAMATAMLTVLYPEDFTVYDQRVCASLGDFVPQSRTRTFTNLGNRNKANIWEGYVEFLEAVRESTPQDLSLRDKDRWLWAKAVVKQMETEIQN